MYIFKLLKKSQKPTKIGTSCFKKRIRSFTSFSHRRGLGAYTTVCDYLLPTYMHNNADLDLAFKISFFPLKSKQKPLKKVGHRPFLIKNRSDRQSIKKITCRTP